MATWQPLWQAGTVYALKAVVIPTTFAGYAWRCTTAGTSGGTEPTWPDPTTGTATIMDGSVTWTVGSAFRQAIQLGLCGSAGIVTLFKDANPTILRSVRTVRPRSFTTTDLPCFYIGDLNESIVHSNGLRTRTVDGFSAFLVDDLGEQIESNDRMNFAVDALTDLFTLNYHAVGGVAIFEQTSTIDTEVTDGATTFAAVEFTFGRTFVTEGRT